MRIRLLIAPCALIAIGRLASVAASADAPPPADLVVLGGRIITLDPQERIVEALAVRDGRIVKLGSTREVTELQGPTTQVVSLQGQSVVPGFIETHCHAVGVARDSVHNEYVELSSIAEIQDWIRREAARKSPGTWIEVPRNEITRLRERRHPTPAEFDAACTSHPVLYTSVTKHVFNSLGWKAIGVVDAESTVPAGEVLRNSGGEPVLLRGGSAHVRKFLATPAVTRDETTAALEKVLARYNEVGITHIFERATDNEGLGLFRELKERGRLPVRVTGTFRFSPRTAEQVEAFVAKLGLKPREGDDWIKAGPLKITVDGGIHWGTTWLSEPYGPRRTEFYRNADPSYSGEKLYDLATMQTVFAAGNRLGWQWSAHVTGDEGTRNVLAAVEAVAKEDPTIRERRFTLIHSYFPAPDIVRTAAELGVGVDTQGYLYYKDADTLNDVYGPAWAERFLGLGAWARAGVPVSINSDHMIGLDPDRAMNAFNPALMLWIAVARKSEGGKVYGPEQRLSRLDALRSVTHWAAKLSFDEDRLGTLESGKLADFVILDGDYLDCSEDDIRRLKVLRTVVGGTTVFERRP